MNEYRVAQGPDIPRQPAFDVLTQPDKADGKDLDEVAEARENIFDGGSHVTEGPRFPGIHEVVKLVDGGKHVRLWNFFNVIRIGR